ncbi:MAG: hydrogenase nickel incorporation protein HypB [Planctomycetota bacterium]
MADSGSSKPIENESQHDHDHAHDHSHERSHEHAHDHTHGDSCDHTAELGRLVLGENERLAAKVRDILTDKAIVAINVVSSPGSGKTTLLEQTLGRLAEEGLHPAVLVGDLATDNDAQRLKATGAPAIQITTGTVCHLDAHMVLHGLDELDLDAVDVLFLENVGNLVCPAAFDLGEDHRVVLSSTTEGEDKPRKYPTIFDGADLALITKMDLAEVLEVDLPELHAAVADVAPDARVLELSSRSGLGLDEWVQFVRESVERKRAALV